MERRDSLVRSPLLIAALRGVQTIAGLRYKVDSNHDLVYLELDEPTIRVHEIHATFPKLGLNPRFIGAIPAEFRPKPKTEPLRV